MNKNQIQGEAGTNISNNTRDLNSEESTSNKKKEVVEAKMKIPAATPDLKMHGLTNLRI